MYLAASVRYLSSEGRRETGDNGTVMDRRIGLEQEFFLLEGSGEPSVRADEFLGSCKEETGKHGSGPACFAPEFVMGLVEVSTPPVRSLADLEREYHTNLRLALGSARSLGLRLYPLGTYPLSFEPVAREDLDYKVQVQTVGPERFIHAGRCAGTHLHLELAGGTVDPGVGISAGATDAARAEALGLNNLATALDPALIFLTRSCPFYEGQITGPSPRTVHYRGGAAFGWEGVYTGLPWAGGLLAYTNTVEQLVRQQFDRYEAWLAAMDRAGIERHLFAEAGGDILRPAWNPVRINRQGTVELRGMDSNYPEVTLMAIELAVSVADRVRREELTVIPDDATRTFEVGGDTLRIPGFDQLSGTLLHHAVAGPLDDTIISEYLDSIIDFAGGGGRLAALRQDRLSGGAYPTTEARILREYGSDYGHISKEDGIRLALEACDSLEAQVPGFRKDDEPEVANASRS